VKRRERAGTGSGREVVGPWAASRPRPKRCPAAFLLLFSYSSFSFLNSILTFAKELQNWFKLNPIIVKFSLVNIDILGNGFDIKNSKT
jgi:hypothetical protein